MPTLRDLLPLGIFMGLGAIVHLCERLWPLRAYEKPKALRLDLIAFAVVMLARIVIERTEEPAIAALPSLPALQWLAVPAAAATSHLSWPVMLAIYVVISDFLLYVGHRLLHTSTLWHTHAAHHSVEHMYWFAGLRASPVHVALLAMWGLLLALVLPIRVGGMRELVTEVVIYASIQHFNHANIRWRLGPLGWLFVTPRYHFVHHGAARRLNNSNFGFLLTIWDRMFGTYTDPDDAPENFRLGLNYRVGTARMLVGLPPQAQSQPQPRRDVLTT